MLSGWCYCIAHLGCNEPTPHALKESSPLFHRSWLCYIWRVGTFKLIIYLYTFLWTCSWWEWGPTIDLSWPNQELSQLNLSEIEERSSGLEIKGAQNKSNRINLNKEIRGCYNRINLNKEIRGCYNQINLNKEIRGCYNTSISYVE